MKSTIEYIKKNTVFIGIFLTAIFLRFVPLSEYQLAHDELSALSRLVFPDLKQTLQLGVQYGDTHPALIHLFLYFWIKLFGTSEIAIKLPFLICGIAVVFLSYRFSKKWFGENAALLVAIFFSASFIFCVYSSYARMYIPGVLFSIGCVHYLFNIIYDNNPKQKDFIWFVVFCLLCGYNNHLNSLFAFTCAIAGLFLIPKQLLKSYLISCAIAVICYLPHLPITLTQLQMGGLGVNDGGWLPPPKPTVLLDFLIALFGTGTAGLINCFILGSVVIFSVIKQQIISKKQLFLLGLFISNYLIIHLYSIYKSPILQFSVLLFSSVCLLFFITSFAQALPKKINLIVCSIILVLLLGQTFLHKEWTGNFHKHVFDKMTTESFDQIDKYGKNNVSSIYFAEKHFVVHYLLKRNKALNFKLGNDSIFTTINSYRTYLSNLKTHHLVMGNADPIKIEIAKEFFPYIDNYSESYFYNLITLSKNKSYQKTDHKSYIIKSENLLNGTNTYTLNTQLKKSGGIYILDSLSGEFPFAYKTEFKNLNAKEGEWLFVKINFEEDSSFFSNEDLLCASINTKDSTKNYFNSSKFSDFHFYKNNNLLYLQLFVGSDLDEWNNTGELTLFVWKKDKSTIKLKDFTVTQLDYNPKKWKVWE